MDYKGRITVTLFVVVMLIVCIVNIHSINYSLFVFFVLFGTVGWLFGKQYDKVKFFSEKDELTNLYNRRFVMKIIPKLFLLAKKNNKKVVISIVDVDNFKLINDTYGHQFGDKVLQDISTAIVTVTREKDIVARWGGDEILIISPVGRFKFPAAVQHKLREVSQQKNVNVNVSIGTAIYPDDGTNFSQLLKEADRNMYIFKETNKKTLAKIN